MTSDIVTTPSRRSVAKGAAWAVPAVAVAATAPSLAASPGDYCENPKFSIDVTCPPIDVNLLDPNSDSVHFTVTNTGDCTVKTGQEFTLDLTGLVGVSVEGLNEINANVAVFFDSTTNGRITKDLAPGESVDIYVFPVADIDVNLQVSGTATLTIAGATLAQKFTLVELDASLPESLGGLANVTLSFCGEPQSVIESLVGSIVEELDELPADLERFLDNLLGDVGLTLSGLLKDLGLDKLLDLLFP